MPKGKRSKSGAAAFEVFPKGRAAEQCRLITEQPCLRLVETRRRWQFGCLAVTGLWCLSVLLPLATILVTKALAVEHFVALICAILSLVGLPLALALSVAGTTASVVLDSRDDNLVVTSRLLGVPVRSVRFSVRHVTAELRQNVRRPNRSGWDPGADAVGCFLGLVIPLLGAILMLKEERAKRHADRPSPHMIELADGQRKARFVCYDDGPMRDFIRFANLPEPVVDDTDMFDAFD